LYPAIDFSKFQKSSLISEKSKLKYGSEFFLSLNRYERKKNVELAIRSYALFKAKNKNSIIKLVIAGGYDPKGEYYKYYYRAASMMILNQLLVFIHIQIFLNFE
jgi:alpha-1,3/alpha-1,6-mannosyltransferase